MTDKFVDLEALNFRSAPAGKDMHDSIVRRDKGDKDPPFWGSRLFEERPEIGDIVGMWRKTPNLCRTVAYSARGERA